jgi:hypothetical protein
VDNLELVVRCKTCGEEIDRWDLDPEDPCVSAVESAADMRYQHDCGGPREEKKAEFRQT